jgi:MFS family permease
MSLILQRFNTRYVLGPLVVIWAVVCAATAGVSTWQGLFVQRFFLGKHSFNGYKTPVSHFQGFVESVIPTSFIAIISSFYTQEEQALRHSWWFSGTGVFTIIGGALNYAFGQITSGALKRWQYIYILSGALTFIFGLWCLAIPNSPVSAWFLTPDERVVAVERLRRGQMGVRCQKIKLNQVRECLTDVKFYLIGIMMASA